MENALVKRWEEDALTDLLSRRDSDSTRLRPSGIFFFFLCLTWRFFFSWEKFESPGLRCLKVSSHNVEKANKPSSLQHLRKDVSLWSNILTQIPQVQGQWLNSVFLAISSSNFKSQFFYFFCSYATTKLNLSSTNPAVCFD